LVINQPAFVIKILDSLGSLGNIVHILADFYQLEIR